MNNLLAVTYLVLCAVAARPLFVLLSGPTSDRRGATLPGRLLCALTAFFVPFIALGWIELLTGQAWVNVEHASGVLTTAVVLLLWARGSGRSQVVTTSPEVARWPTPRLVLLTTGSVYAALLGFTLAQFPRGFEVAAYQLPSAVHILQTASIQAWDPHYPHTFPQNPGLYFGFFLSFLPERLAAASNFVFVAVLVACVYRLARQVGADRRAALIATCGLLTLPMVAFAAGELNADLGGVAFLALAMVFALEDGLPRRWLLSGLAAGLAFGFKTMHLVPLSFLCLCALSAGWHETASAGGSVVERVASAWRAGAIFALGVLITAGIWLARNAIEYGNPLYPVNVPLIGQWLGWSVDPEVDFSSRHATQFEWVTAPWHWLGYPWFEWQQLGQNFKFDAGLGPYFATAVPVAWLASLVVGLRHGWARTWQLQVLSLCSALILAVWWLMDDRQPRYLLGAQILLVPMTAWLLSAQQSGRARVWLERLFAMCIFAMLLVVLSKEAIHFGDRVVLSGQTTRTAFYEYPPMVDELPPGTTIMNLGSRTWHYPLFGAHLHNRVISTPKARALLDLRPGLGGINGVTLDAPPLRQEGVDYVFSDGGEIQVAGCLSLHEVYRQDVNPLNQVRLTQPRLLHRVQYCEPSLDETKVPR